MLILKGIALGLASFFLFILLLILVLAFTLNNTLLGVNLLSLR